MLSVNSYAAPKNAFLKSASRALILARMSARSRQDMKNSLRQLYVEDGRPWPVGFSSLPICHPELVEGSLSFLPASFVIVDGRAPFLDDKRLKLIGYRLELRCRDVEF